MPHQRSPHDGTVSSEKLPKISVKKHCFTRYAPRWSIKINLLITLIHYRLKRSYAATMLFFRKKTAAADSCNRAHGLENDSLIRNRIKADFNTEESGALNGF